MVPQGAIAVKNPVGTAPAFIVEFSPSHPTADGQPANGSIISLPGVPHEMEHILHESIIPYLQERFDLATSSRCACCTARDWAKA